MSKIPQNHGWGRDFGRLGTLVVVSLVFFMVVCTIWGVFVEGKSRKVFVCSVVAGAGIAPCQ